MDFQNRIHWTKLFDELYMVFTTKDRKTKTVNEKEETKFRIKYFKTSRNNKCMIENKLQ